MRSVTVDDVMSWEPCGPYTTERVTSLFAGRARVTALDVCAMDIPVKDILWAVLRKNMVEERVLHLFACWCAEQALIAEREAGREPELQAGLPSKSSAGGWTGQLATKSW